MDGDELLALRPCREAVLRRLKRILKARERAMRLMASVLFLRISPRLGSRDQANSLAATGLFFQKDIVAVYENAFQQGDLC